MTSSESGATPPQKAAPAAAPLPCPRCHSMDTKFCYYNNYNLSQPRYFCKSCRRYWTRGGALRDVPVGGGSRKSAKRSRTASPSSSATTTATSTTTSSAAVSPAIIPTIPVYSGQFPAGCGGAGGFTSLLSLGGFGLGLGLDEVRYGYGLGSSNWILPETGFVSGNCGGGDDGGPTWHVEGGVGGGGEGGGDYFSTLPELAISTPSNVLK
ncbi:hypothetical protein RND81_11G221500 [Saponaria officinalis]|uniref:Dof zinc finger protein n=1 Tax=Saponaria officinalis TaxID=3572 RepID=A0AAW1HPC3_SAPOF